MENMGLIKRLHQVYQGKKILLTGHTGFKGSWFLSILHRLGAEVKGYALVPRGNSLYLKINGDDYCDSVIADIRDRARVKKEIVTFKPDFIFHFAAQPLVRLSYEIPVDTFETNLMGTINVLDSLLSFSDRTVVVIITTDKVYLNLEHGEPFKETDPLGGFDPYSASKAAAEIAVSSFRESYFKNEDFAVHQKSISTARAGNVIGGGDWSQDRLMPDVIHSLIERKEVRIRNPKAVRPWQHVLEPLVGYLTLGMSQYQSPIAYNESWNFGPYPDDNQPVEHVVASIIKRWGSGEIKQTGDHKKSEANLLKLDIQKAVNRLGWTPQLSIDKTLDLTIDWYRRNCIEGEDARFILEEQIETYFNLLP